MSYRGERLGLPQSGPGSVPGIGLRFVALFIDNALCQLIARAFSTDKFFVPYGVMVLEIILFTWLIGGSVGQRLLSMRVASLNKPRLTLLDVAMRTFLMLLVIPAAIYDRDQRGLHDRAVGSVVVRG